MALENVFKGHNLNTAPRTKGRRHATSYAVRAWIARDVHLHDCGRYSGFLYTARGSGASRRHEAAVPDHFASRGAAASAYREMVAELHVTQWRRKQPRPVRHTKWEYRIPGRDLNRT